MLGENAGKDQAPQGGQGQPAAHAGADIFSLIDSYVAQFVDGSAVTDDHFTDVVDQDTADKLKGLGVKRITNKQGDITISLLAEREEQTPRVAVKVKTEIKFHFERTGSKTTVTKLSGIQARVNRLLGWMDVTGLTAEKEVSTGNVVIDVSVKALFTTVKHRVTLGPDGKPFDQ